MDESFDIKISKLNECYFYLECSPEIKKELNNYFSIHVKGFQFNPLYKAHRWNGKKNFYNATYSLLPIGLSKMLSNLIQAKKYTYQINIPNKANIDFYTGEYIESLFKKYVTNPKIELRDYQLESIRIALNKKRGILLNATGSGKSLVIYLLIREYLQNNSDILLIVPSKDLVKQMYDDFIDYGWKDIHKSVSQIHGEIKNKNFNNKIIISTFHSLTDLEPEYFEKFNSILVDEAHRSSNISIETSLKHCINAENRIGLTGSLMIDRCELTSVYSYLGTVLYEVQSKTLQDQGHLSQSNINIVKIKYSEEICENNCSLDYKIEKNLIMKSKERTQVLDFIYSEIGEDSNNIIFFEEIDHLNNTFNYLKNKYPEKEIYITFGQTDLSERDSVKQLMNTKKGITILASFGVASTGVNLPSLNTIVFFGFLGKSKVRIIQSIGRGSRKTLTKNSFNVYDIVDDLEWNGTKNHLLKHYFERIKIYKSQNFDYKEIDFNLD